VSHDAYRRSAPQPTSSSRWARRALAKQRHAGWAIVGVVGRFDHARARPLFQPSPAGGFVISHRIWQSEFGGKADLQIG
jgi:hypothetical protein